MINNFLADYFDYVSYTEPPKIFHLWSVIAGVSALAGRKIWWKNGPMTIYPNLYIMLIGSPGTRKSTAIKSFKRLMKQADYDTFAADRSTKQKFLLDLEIGFDFANQALADEQQAVGLASPKISKLLSSTVDKIGKQEQRLGPHEVFVAADEFMDFFGVGNMEFAALLGVLWDKEDAYTDRLKNSKSVYIPEPTVSILGGATHENFKMMFPPELLGQGFMSRLIMIHGEGSGKKLTFLNEDDQSVIAKLSGQLRVMKDNPIGLLSFSADAKDAIDKIYQTWTDIEDARFRYYSTRRFTQLIKLLLTYATMQQKAELDINDVVFANTLLTHAEMYMPKAMGEYGKSRNSETAHKVIDVLEHTLVPLSYKDIWKQVAMDVEKQQDLLNLLQGLLDADKIQKVGSGFMVKKVVKVNKAALEWVDFKLLTQFGISIY
jgi:hypothetical protein